MEPSNDFQDLVYTALIATSITTCVTEDRLLLAQLKNSCLIVLQNGFTNIF